MYPIKPVQSIDFSILTKDNISKISKFPDSGITVPELYENSVIKHNGLLDPKMGTSRMEIVCETCRLNNKYCPGHFGHINLAYPLVHIGYMPYIKTILGCVCIRCSALKIYPQNQNFQKLIKNAKGVKRLDIVKNLTKDIKNCRICNAQHPKIKILNKKDKQIIDFNAEYTTTTGQPSRILQLTNEYIYTIFKNISDQDCIYMGLEPKKSRPEDLFYTYFPVPPIPSRPSAKVPGLNDRDDPITNKLVQIIRNNNDIISSKDQAGIENKIRMAQYYANVIFSNNNQYSLKLETSNAPDDGIIEKIKSKEGIIRNNLMGKRNNYTARTVITGDPMLDDDQVGIPLFIAQKLTFTEIVTKNNIARLTQYLKNGPNKYPGANAYIPLIDGEYPKHIDLKMVQRPIELKYGDKLERHMIDGDIVFFNRQPSLHKYSMMALKAKIFDNPDYTTFRFNVGITEPFHADFDGDAMTITIPRCTESKIEIEKITSIKYNLVNTQTSTTTIGCKLDTLTAIYILTKFEKNISADRVMNILSYLEHTDNISDFVVDKKKVYTGKELFSFILPKKLNIKDKNFTIKDGELIDGIIGKTELKEKQENSILRIILDLYDEDEAKIFFDNVQKLLNIYFINRGITFGIQDVEMAEDILKKGNTIIQDTFLEVGKQTTEIENDPSLIPAENYEMYISGLLDNTRSKGAVLVKNTFDKMGNLEILRSAGTNGKIKDENIAKNLIVDGQNLSENQRLPKLDNRRTQPYFCRDIDMPYERGYNSNSFYHGFNTYEFIWNAYTAREGLINIQLKTPDSGYVQRKFVKSLEDYHIDYDGLVKNVNDGIVQFVYSDSNIDATRQYKCKINVLMMDDNEVKEKYTFTDDELKQFKDFSKKDNDDYYKYLIEARDIIRDRQLRLHSDFIAFDNLCKFYLPVSLNKIKSLIKPSSRSDLSPKYVIDKINDLLKHENTSLLCIRKSDISNKSVKIQDEQTIKLVLKLYLMDVLGPKKCINEYKLTKNNFDEILADFIKSFKKSLINPGEMVGVIAATSLCENVTQTNLNSHHLTGVSTKTAANAGFDRMLEIFNYSKNIKTPQTTIHFNNKAKGNENFIKQVATFIRQTILSEIYDSVNAYYDPNNEHKTDGCTNIFKMSDTGMYPYYTNDFNKLPWLIVIKLQKDMMLLKNIQLLDIIIKFLELWNNKELIVKKSQIVLRKMFNSIINMSIASNNDNDEENIIHIRFNMVDYNYETVETFTNFILEYTLIKGIDNIKEADTESMQFTTFDNPTHKLDETQKEYFIRTIGINIDKIRRLRNVDQNRTKINDIETIYKTYGIEATRMMLIDELNSLTGNQVMFNHISLIVDYMTRDGYILSIDRNGLDKSESSLLNKISFEKPGPKILNACLFNESDNLNGVSGRIMTGRLMRGGTGYCNLMFNTDMVMNSEYTDYNAVDVNNDVVNEEYNSMIESEMNIEDEGIFIP